MCEKKELYRVMKFLGLKVSLTTMAVCDLSGPWVITREVSYIRISKDGSLLQPDIAFPFVAPKSSICIGPGSEARNRNGMFMDRVQYDGILVLLLGMEFNDRSRGLAL